VGTCGTCLWAARRTRAAPIILAQYEVAPSDGRHHSAGPYGRRAELSQVAEMDGFRWCALALSATMATSPALSMSRPIPPRSVDADVQIVPISRTRCHLKVL
jgi:hypothetical protein